MALGQTNIPVPLNVDGAPQEITWVAGEYADGRPNVQIVVQSPYSTSMVILNEDGGVKLRDFLIETFGSPGGLAIVRDLPPDLRGNGHGR